MPQWIVDFTRRLLGLGDGRYLIVLTVRDGRWDWTVQSLGKVELSTEE